MYIDASWPLGAYWHTEAGAGGICREDQLYLILHIQHMYH